MSFTLKLKSDDAFHPVAISIPDSSPNLLTTPHKPTRTWIFGLSTILTTIGTITSLIILVRAQNDPTLSIDKPGYPWPVVITLPLCIFGLMFSTVFYCILSFRADRQLGFKSPDPQKVRHRARKAKHAWVNVEELRKAKPKCRFVGRAYQKDDDCPDDKRWMGTYWRYYDWERWEDRTKQEEIARLEEFLKKGGIPVLKIFLTVTHTLESPTLNTKLKNFKREFADNYTNLIPDYKPDTTRYFDGAREYRPKMWTECEVAPQFDDPLPSKRQQNNIDALVDQKILYVYQGKHRPWWTSGAWWRLWFWLGCGGFWELWIGKGFAEMVEDVVIRKALF